MVLTAAFAQDVGLFYGEMNTFILHIGASIAVIPLYIFWLVISLFLYKIVDLILPMRVRLDQEKRGNPPRFGFRVLFTKWLICQSRKKWRHG